MPGSVPETTERDRRELELQVALGPLLMATQGWSAPDVESTYARAFELCKRVDDAPRLFPTLRGLWEFYEARGELEKAKDLGKQLFALAERSHDSGLRLVAHDVFADMAFWTGDLLDACEHAQRGLAARHQNAKSFELRATVSLARLFVEQTRRDEARALLGPIYNWFTEGFDTCDLLEAKALLEE